MRIGRTVPWLRDVRSIEGIKESSIPGLAEDILEAAADLPLGPRRADHVVLDQHPATEVQPRKRMGPF